MKTVDFSKTFAASDLKGSRSRHLEFMKVCEFYEVPLTLAEHDSNIKIKAKNPKVFCNQILCL